MKPSGLWGSPGSVTVERLHGLPEQMQREGVLMLADMGEPEGITRRRLGLSAGEMDVLVNGSLEPWRRAEEPFSKVGSVE